MNKIKMENLNAENEENVLAKKEWIEPAITVLFIEATAGGGVDAGFGGTLPT